MPQSHEDSKKQDRTLSRRSVVKGGLSTVAGAVATFMAARSSSAAVTGMDSAKRGTLKKGNLITQDAVTGMD